VFVASVGAVLGVSAAGVAAPPRAAVDQHFLAELRGHGHAVAQGEDEALVVSAARKICQRRDSRTYVQRRAATLTRDELAAVKRSLGDDPQGFIAVATDTFCS
jgi:Protein of unknown function (DUF732)